MKKSSFYAKLEKIIITLILVVLVFNFTAPSVIAAGSDERTVKLFPSVIPTLGDEETINLLSNDIWQSTIKPLWDSLGFTGVLTVGSGLVGAITAGGFPRAINYGITMAIVSRWSKYYSYNG